MAALNVLLSYGFAAEHSGSYTDPVTGKIRQFDLRGTRDKDDVTVAVAVECKSLSPSAPILVSALERQPLEAIHTVITRTGLGFATSGMGPSRIYQPKEFVGKRAEQISRNLQDGSVGANSDRDAFETWNQAVNSCRDLCLQMVRQPRAPDRRVVIPMMVVPGDCLWQMNYDGLGNALGAPQQVHAATLYLDHLWMVRNPDVGLEVACRLSHLEILTIEGLPKRIEQLFAFL